MRDDLKERLRAMVTNRPDSLGICTSWHRNPDGPEAADRIAALEAKLAEKDALLRECGDALLELADLMDDVLAGTYWPDSFTCQPARTTLTKIKDATDAD